MMNRQNYRSVGAIVGLAIAVSVMKAVGHSGVVALFCYGTTGAVIGGMVGERLHSVRVSRSDNSADRK